MKLIDDDVLTLIAGGWTESPTEVVIPGDRLWNDFVNYWWEGVSTMDERFESYYVENPQSGGGGEPPLDKYDCTKHTSAAPLLVPANVNLESLRDMVQRAADFIGTLDSKIEHGVFVIRAADGTLRTTPLATGPASGGTVNMDFVPIAGESVVAWVHSHPTGTGTDQRIPSYAGSANTSGGDIGSMQGLVREASVDDNALLYIVDRTTSSVYEYTAAGINAARPLGANITNDTVPTCGVSPGADSPEPGLQPKPDLRSQFYS